MSVVACMTLVPLKRGMYSTRKQRITTFFEGIFWDRGHLCFGSIRLAASLFKPLMRHQIDCRQHEQDHRRRGQYPADYYAGQRALRFRTDARGDRRGQQPDRGRQRRHQHRAHSQLGAALDGLAQRRAFLAQLLDLRDQDHAVQHIDAEQRKEADSRRDAEVRSGNEQRKHAAGHRERHHAEKQRRIAQAAESAVKQEEDDQDADGNGDRQPAQRLLQFLKLARYFVVVFGGQLYLRLDPRLDVFNRALQVSPSDAEFDRDVTLVVFAVNEGRAGLFVDLGQLFERDALALGRVDLDVADRFDALAKLRQESHDDVESLFAVEKLSHRLAADGRLPRRVDVARQDAVARRLVPVGADQQVRLAEFEEDAEVGHAGNPRHHVPYPVGRRRQLFEIGAEKLDRVFALDARHRLFDVVLNGLREVVDHARDSLQFVVALLDQIGFDAAPRPLIERLQIDDEFAVEITGRIGAVVWAPQLADDRGHLGMSLEDRAHLVGELAGVRVRDRVRHRGAHVYVALLELRHELAAEAGKHHAARDQRDHRQADRDCGPGERDA